MRVIAGSLGGRRFTAPQGRGTRPTPERVREALFSSLGDVGGLAVLDLFAGSGALAIEALSRGAASAVLVDRDRAAAAVIARNIEALGLDDRAAVLQEDALAALSSLGSSGERFDLVLIDPPYAEAESLAERLAPALVGVLADGARVVCESDRRSPIELGGLPVVFERRYGDTLLRIHQN